MRIKMRVERAELDFDRDDDRTGRKETGIYYIQADKHRDSRKGCGKTEKFLSIRSLFKRWMTDRHRRIGLERSA